MKEFYKTENEALERVKEIDTVMQFPDDTGTLTYAVPQPDEESGEWWFEVGSDYLTMVENIEK